MTAKQLERLVVVAEKLEVSFAALVALMEKRLELEHPPVGEIEDAQIVRVGEGQKEPESKDEYNDFPIGEETSFESILTKLKEASQ